MNPLRLFCLVACLTAVAMASPSQQSSRRNSGNNNSLKPSEWLSPQELAALPDADKVTMEQLDNMSAKKGAELIDTIFHVAQCDEDDNLTPSYVPSKNSIPSYIIKTNGQNVSVSLDQLVSAAKSQPNFGDEEVTIFIIGYPQNTRAAKKATTKLVQAYMERYDAELEQKKDNQRLGGSKKNKNNNNNRNSNEDSRSDSDEDYNDNWSQSQRTPTGDLIVIDLGDACRSLARLMKLNVEETGKMIAQVLAKLTNECDVPEEIVHIVAQGPAAHVAGVAGREFTRITGHQMRRITALDPSKIFAKNPNTLTGLARGDAEFVDAIHTSSCGLGTPTRVGDVDFYPNGPCADIPGADSVVEEAMRATRYFAESVRPGNERNFPAVNANSLEEYNAKNGHGKRAYMGIATDFDLQGDYILKTNAKSPFGKSSPASKQAYHGAHNSWKSMAGQ